MKKFLSGVLLLLVFSASSQDVIPLIDFNGYFKSFQDGFFRQIEFQRIKSFKTGDNVCAYIDFKGNLRIYDGSTPKNITNIESVEYKVSDCLMTWKIGETLNMWDAGDLRTLSYRTGIYWMSDSIVVYQDLRFNTLNAYYNGEVHELSSWVGDEYRLPPYAIGPNTVVFKDNADMYKVFWRGKIYELDITDMSRPFQFTAGTDILAFNDLINGTFAVFHKGVTVDVEMYNVDSYKAGIDFIVYENLNGELMMYKNNKIVELSNFGANYWDVKDDVVVWEENSFMYTYYDGEKKEVARYTPEDYEIKNGVIVFRNLMGGVSAFIEGKLYEITNQMDAQYSIHGNSVLVTLFNNSYIVLQNGKKYTI